jgi:putative membrane protein
MLLITLLFAGLAAAIHVYIFVLESLRWDRPSTRKAFGIKTDTEANATKPLAFNQGFYNLFLAVITVAGMAFALASSTTVGATLIFAGAGSMVAAGLVLLLSSPKLASAAMFQLTAPALAIIFGLFAFSH